LFTVTVTGGVGSAANAGVGLIVGYVGASHVPPESKEKHAKLLMAGTRADNGQGAAVVIEDMHDLMPLVVSSSTSVNLTFCYSFIT
jgi:hypothetical protein